MRSSAGAVDRHDGDGDGAAVLARVGDVGLGDHGPSSDSQRRDDVVRDAVDGLAEAGPHVAHGVAAVHGVGVAEAHDTSSARCAAKRSGSIESMSSNSCGRSAMVVRGLRRREPMFEPGMIRGTHHLTFCVGGAQEDYDFHVRAARAQAASRRPCSSTARSRSTTSTTRNRVGDAITILTSFPYRQAGWMGRRGTNQLQLDQRRRARRLDRLLGRPAARRGRRGRRRSSASARSGSSSPIRAGSRTRSSARPSADDARAVGRQRGPARARDPRRLRHHHLGARARADGRVPAPRRSARHVALRGAAPPVPGRHRRGRRPPDRARRGARPAAGHVAFGEGTIHHHAFDSAPPRTRRRSRTGSSASASPTSPTSRTAATSSVYMRTPGGALFELAYSDGPGFTLDEAEDELGHAHVHPAALGGPARGDRPARADRHRGDRRRVSNPTAVRAARLGWR